MSQYREYPPSNPRLIGYDPHSDLPANHLARLVDHIVDETIHPGMRRTGKGQPPFNPRLTLKVLLYAYAMGIRSSRQMERLCQESLPFLFLTRGDCPSYRTLCFTRIRCKEEIEQIWIALMVTAQEAGLKRMGRIVVDSTKLRANASPEAVLKAGEYAPMRAELTRILAEADAADKREETEGASTTAVLDAAPSTEQMRDIVRRVRSQISGEKRQEKDGKDDEDGHPDSHPDSNPALSAKMRTRIVQTVAAIDEAETEERKHLCLTDPEARMLGEGRSKQVKECHSFEVAMDNGLIVASGVTTQQDNFRLKPLLEAAAKNEPEGVKSVDADSGYWRGDDIVAIEASGIETCIPDPFTACDLRKGLSIGTTRSGLAGKVPFTRDEEKDAYDCPEGNRLTFHSERFQEGQTLRLYRAEESCEDCLRSQECLTHKKAKRRCLSVSVHKGMIQSVLERFRDLLWQDRYHDRAPQVETTFGFLRSTLGYVSWSLRGTARVACEAALLTAAYQFRKVHSKICSGVPNSSAKRQIRQQVLRQVHKDHSQVPYQTAFAL